MKIVSERFTVATEFLTFFFFCFLFIFISITDIFRWFRPLIHLATMTVQEKEVYNTDGVAETKGVI